MKGKNKENATLDFIGMIKESWTWARLTENEKKSFEDSVIWSINQNVIIGTYEQRYKILNALYHTFLQGVGYTGWKWREEKNILTQEQKDNIIHYHWFEGTMEEHLYYKELMKDNPELKKVYEECAKKMANKYGYGGIDYQWDWDNEDYEQWELDLMSTLDEVLDVGVYKD